MTNFPDSVIRDGVEYDRVAVGGAFESRMFYVNVVPKKSISVIRCDANLRYEGETVPGLVWSNTRTFAVGDTAEYDSYNLSYTSEITGIGAKTVSFGKEGKRLNTHTFSWRNWDFNAGETAAKNAETMMYL